MKRRFDPAEARQAPSVVAAWVLGADGVRWHLRALATAAVLLVLVNIAVDPARLWSLPMIGVWTIVLAVHAGLAGVTSTWVASAAPAAATAALGARKLVPARMPGAPSDPAVQTGAPKSNGRGPIAARAPGHGSEAPSPSRPAGGEQASSASPGNTAERRAPLAAAGSGTPVDRVAGVGPIAAMTFGPMSGDVPLAAEPAPRAAGRTVNGPLPEAVVALWGPSVPAAAPTMVEHVAGWRWGPPTDASAPAPSSFAPPPRTADGLPAASARRTEPTGPMVGRDETVPVALLTAEAAPDSSLTGD